MTTLKGRPYKQHRKTKMESNRLVIAALLFIVAIVAINFAMFVIARNWAKGENSPWVSAIRDSLNKSTQSSSSKSMDELRQKMEELENKKKEE
jgi:hypothetical protein